MLRPDRFIASCASWREFWEGTKRLSSTSEKGVVFERLTQLYLQTVPEYQSELAHIWTLHEVPPHVRKRLGLPALDEVKIGRKARTTSHTIRARHPRALFSGLFRSVGRQNVPKVRIRANTEVLELIVSAVR